MLGIYYLLLHQPVGEDRVSSRSVVIIAREPVELGTSHHSPKTRLTPAAHAAFNFYVALWTVGGDRYIYKNNLGKTTNPEGYLTVLLEYKGLLGKCKRHFFSKFIYFLHKIKIQHGHILIDKNFYFCIEAIILLRGE